MFPIPTSLIWPIAGAIAAAIYTGVVYHAGWDSAHQQHLQYVEREQAILAKQQADEKRRKEQANATIAELNKAHAQDLAAVRDSWARWMRDHGPGRAAAPQPTRIEASVCDSEADNARLSEAVQRYVDGIRTAAAEFGAGAAGLLEEADTQVRTLLNLQDAWERLRLINSE